ncbi:MAG: alpha/beta hydrolase [Pseudomonadota bacterium]
MFIKEGSGIVSCIRSSILWGIVTGVLAACATPAERITSEATSYGFTSQVIEGSEFKHRIYRNNHQGRTHGSTLHVYLEGDGAPWINHERVARDPTPRTPLMLRLMASDTAPSLYLGRPCYHGYSRTAPCSPGLWTDARYSEIVIASMTQVLDKLIEGGETESLVFFGHSGGGALAMLLAERFPGTRAVVTIAGNLDIDAWAGMHRYTKLHRSLNPANRKALNPRIHQLHLVGEDDTNITPQLIQEVESRQENSELVIVTGFDHTCCWQELWPEVLAWTAALETSAQHVRKDFRLN